jgi:hypothetical protein
MRNSRASRVPSRGGEHGHVYVTFAGGDTLDGLIESHSLAG